MLEASAAMNRAVCLSARAGASSLSFSARSGSHHADAEKEARHIQNNKQNKKNNSRLFSLNGKRASSEPTRVEIYSERR